MDYRILQFTVLLLLISAGLDAADQDSRRVLEYVPAPADNPLKGLVPYQGDAGDVFPHSMEFNYIRYSDLVKGYGEFDWQPLENMLDDIASRGNQTIFRVVLEYPGKENLIPAFLLRDGLIVHSYLNTNTAPFPPTKVETPDYEDRNLRRSLKQFIAALGAKYDGDPRIGFITAGLLGTWGEWHCYPREELFASQAVQIEVMEAYEAAFTLTPILLRYPTGAGDPRNAQNDNRPFGYHDDSFSWATLETGKRDDDWFFVPLLDSAGPQARSKWKHFPIGGEIRPEAWGEVFDDSPKHPIQNFRDCVRATHVSWLMDSGMFEKPTTPARIKRAEQEVRGMGYEFHVLAVTIDNEQADEFKVKVEVENRGVSPFYYHWPMEFGLLVDDKPVATFPAKATLKGLLPGQDPLVWEDVLKAHDVPAGNYDLALRVPNPMKGGKSLRFANATQHATLDWLVLDSIAVR